MAAAGMKLRKWNLNSHKLIQKLRCSTAFIKGLPSTSMATRNMEEEDEMYARAVIRHFVLSSLIQTLRILGVIWDPFTDVFSFNFTQLSEYTKTMEITKRSILRLTAKIFDPLDFVSPFIIQLKTLFQILCAGKIE